MMVVLSERMGEVVGSDGCDGDERVEWSQRVKETRQGRQARCCTAIIAAQSLAWE